MGTSCKIVCCMAGVLPALGPLPAAGQSYPTRPVEIIVTTSPGSGGDLVSRAVSEIARREKLLPQPLVVVNRVGGAGVLGYTYFKTRHADPYHMMSVTQTILSMAYRPDVKIGLENYRPLALMAIDPQTIMVPASKTLRVLAIASNQRLPQAPDVPTLKELGYPITAGTIRGFAFMAGVPKEAVATMEGALAKVHASATWKEIAARNIFEDVFMGSAEFAKYLTVRMEEYRQYYDAIGYARTKP